MKETMKKYEFTGEIKIENGVVLKRIKALKSFGHVIKDDVGGWIENESNLSQERDCWVSGNAMVHGDANVCGDAKVSGNAEVCGDAKVSGNAVVCGNAWVWDNAKVCGDAWVSGNAVVCGNAWVWDNAKVCGDAEVYGDAWVSGNAEVFSESHVLVIGAIGSRNDFTTFYRGKNKQIMVKCGCFNDTIDKFIEKVKSTHGNNKYALVYMAAVDVARLQIDLEGESQESEEEE